MGKGARTTETFDPKKDIEQKAEKSMKFFHWIQEYTKKIVTITFILFVLANMIFLGLGIMSYINSGGEMGYFNALVSEFHQTFREVIGGYIIKAGVENVLKISSGIVEKVLYVKFGIPFEDTVEKEEYVEG